eukprot:scaffold677821_cov57-Prasinocladus_malaysianus.AAC.1
MLECISGDFSHVKYVVVSTATYFSGPSRMAKFPTSDPPGFDDSYVHIEILQLYLQLGKRDRKALDAPQLERSLLVAGR